MMKGRDTMSNLAQNLLYENRKYEVINGIVINMAPLAFESHASLSGNIYTIFNYYLKGKRCKAYHDNMYVRLDKIKDIILPDKNKNDKLIPDVMVVCNRDIIHNDGIYGAPDLVVEVLSKSTSARDRNIKKELYEIIGVKEYWIVSVVERSIEVYLLKNGKYVFDNTYHQYSEMDIEAIMEDVLTPDKSIIREFKTSIFDDLVVLIDDIFDKLD